MPRNPACTACELHTRAQTVCMEGALREWGNFGSVPTTVRIMFVGENPGQREDEQGQPFVGPAGDLLDRVAHELDLPEAFLTNVTRCLGWQTMVRTEDGAKRIGEIVSHRYAGRVWSVDAQGHLCLRPIIGWYRSPLAGRKVVRLSFKAARTGPQGSARAVVTEDHSILTQRGFAPAAELQPDDLVCTGLPDFGLRQRQLAIVASELGDGCLLRGTMLQFCHSDKQSDYLEHKHRLLSTLHPSEIHHEIRDGYASGRFALPALRAGLDLPAGDPVEATRRLDDFGVACWYMDDGFLQTIGNCEVAEIAATRYSPETLEQVVEVLCSKGLDCYTRHGRIRFNVRQVKTLSARVAPYIIPSMRYKLCREHRDTPFCAGAWEPEQPSVLYSPAVVEPAHLKENTVYCIDVDETHNFVTAGGVVHNCTKGPSGSVLPKKSIGACAPYLDEEIAAYQPTHILALGAPAFQRMGGKGKITDAAGKEFWSEKYRAWVVPALHPAAILRTPALEGAWREDLRRFADLVKGAVPDLPPLEWTYGAPGALVYPLSIATSITYDFEATPIPWWHKDWKAYSVAFSCIIGGEEHTYVLPLQHPESPFGADELASFFEAVRPVMQNPAVQKTTWNDLYDACAWNRVAGYFPYTTCDAMALAHLINENAPKSLKWNGRTWLGWPDWDIDATQEHPLDELAKYNAYDAYAAYLLREHFLEELRNDEEHGEHLLRYFGNLVMPSIRSVGKMMARGIYVDPEALAQRREMCGVYADAARLRIPVENPGSRDQVARWLYDEEQLPVYKRTPTGKASTDEATINLLARQFPAAKTVLEYRKWTKNESTYFAPAQSMILTSTDQRAHFDYRSTSVETGRYGSRFHTQPRDQFVRSIFSAPPGWTLLSADYSQLEARIAAWWAAGKPRTWDEVDPARSKMLLAFRDNRDVYVETAAAVLGKAPAEVDCDKHNPNNERQIMGKVPSLSMIYKISSEGFREYAWNQYEIAYTEAEAAHIHRAFYSQWPEIAEWHRLAIELLHIRGYAQNPLGRLRHLAAELKSPDKEIRAAAERSGINAPVQGCASNINDAAHVILDRMFESLPAPQPFHVGIVHDANLVECPDDLVIPTAETMRIVMTQTVPRVLRQLGLHLPEGLLKCELQAGSWGSGHEIP